VSSPPDAILASGMEQHPISGTGCLPGSGLPPDEVREQVERILRHKGFVHAGKLSRLLRFTVEKGIQGHGGELKEYVLGVSVFERNAAFDPRLDSIVRVQMGKLRARLKEYYETDGRDDPISVEYFVGRYAPVITRRSPEAPPPEASPPQPVARGRRWRLRAVLACAVLLAAGAAFYAVWRPKAKPDPGARPSVAVLPFVNLDRNAEGDYLSDGITEQLIHSLAASDHLSVVARTSVFHFKGKTEDIRKIGAELNVRTLVEGSVQRQGERIRVSAQLIDAASGYQMWSATYDREVKGILEIQDEITRAITRALQVRLSPTAAGRRPADPEAYRLYLQGRYLWHRRTADELHRARDFFRRALAIDPNYAAAYAGLADSYSILATYGFGLVSEAGPKAVEAARRAVALDDQLADAHAALGFALAAFTADWTEAERAFRRATQLSPSHATAHQWYAISYLALFGRLDEALQEMELAVALDPVSVAVHYDLGRVLECRKDFARAAEEYRRAIELEPNFVRAHAALGRSFDRLGRPADALAEFRRAVDGSGGAPARLADLALHYATTGEKAQARSALAKIKDSADPYQVALVYAALDEKSGALEYLRRGIRSRRSPGVILTHLRDLRSDPQFGAALREAGL
jgi:TolB-like protein/tetratricopeptide (TPR) repeat protein